MYTGGLDAGERRHAGRGTIVRNLIGRPAGKIWAVLCIGMLAILAVTSHDALSSPSMWLLFGGLVIVLSTLCTWLLFGPGTKE